MSKAPFSRPDADDTVGGSHRTKDFSLNILLIGRQPKTKPWRLFGIVVVAFFLLSLQLTACGNTASPLGSASPTSNSTSQSGTPSTTSSSAPGSTSASTSTAGPTKNPTTGPTTDPTAGPTTNPTTGPTTGPTVEVTAPPSSFTVSEQNFYITCSASGQCDNPDTLIEIDNNSNPILPLVWSVIVTPDPTYPAWPTNALLSVNPSRGTLDKPSDKVHLIASNLKAHLPPGDYHANLVWSPENLDPSANHIVTVTLTVAPSGPTVSGINPKSGPEAGSTSVTITGTGFTDATGVSFGSTAASGFTVDSDTQITATSPAGSGTVDVTVTTPNGTASAQFTYT